MEIVLNKEYGGFSLSDRAIEMYESMKGLSYLSVDESSFEFRTDRDLIAIVKALGSEASGRHADLQIEDFYLPEIKDNDGIESI